MTDNEIIKALECCSKHHNTCGTCCPMDSICNNVRDCLITLSKNALDLIRRQKAEIERLQKKANTPFAEFTFDENKLKEIVSDAIKNIEFNLNSVKSEAIKEFAERLKCGVPQETGVIRCADVDNLVKEMTEIETNQRKEDEGK